VAFVTLLDIVDAIMKQSGPKVPCCNDILGSKHTREMATTRTIVAIIQDFFGFVDGKTLPKYGVNPTSIENIFYEEISGGLMMDASTIMLREMRLKIMCVKVDEEVTVLGIIEGDE
jgi:hypothetical protein